MISGEWCRRRRAEPLSCSVTSRKGRRWAGHGVGDPLVHYRMRIGTCTSVQQWSVTAQSLKAMLQIHVSVLCVVLCLHLICASYLLCRVGFMHTCELVKTTLHVFNSTIPSLIVCTKSCARASCVLMGNQDQETMLRGMWSNWWTQTLRAASKKGSQLFLNLNLFFCELASGVLLSTGAYFVALCRTCGFRCAQFHLGCQNMHRELMQC